MKRLVWGIGAAALAATFTPAAQAATVRTASGTVAGITTAAATEYLGIPYAAAPVGALRWAPPQPAAPWSGVLQAGALPSPCPQDGGAYGTNSTDEDCLYLNIYAPLAAAKTLPVMVWIHGGADSSGTGDGYDGTALVQDNVIVVTINYRLGILGFLAHPALDGTSGPHASGDYGLMDQQAALRWVRANIPAFGGDADNVTVFGESAGGQNILDHLASPGAAGLFRHAIVESGGYVVQLHSLKRAEADGVAFANAVGCTSSTDAGCLRQLTVPQILAAQVAETSAVTTPDSLLRFTPNVGTSVLPVQPLAAIASGFFNRVSVLDGSNHDEGRVFTASSYDYVGMPLTASTYAPAIANLVGSAIAPIVTGLYLPTAYGSPGLAYSAAFTDFGFACSRRGYDKLLARNVPVHVYEFADENAARLFLPADPAMPLGAPHGGELPFLYPNLITAGQAMTGDELALAADMRAAWTNFARNGDPNGPGVTSWPGFKVGGDGVHELVPPTPSQSRAFDSFHRCGFWTPVLALDAILPPGTF